MSKVITFARKKKPSDWIRFILLWASAFITVAILVYIVGFILVRGVPYITPSLFSPTFTTENQSLFPALVTTVLMVGLTLSLAVPFESSPQYILSNTPLGGTSLCESYV